MFLYGLSTILNLFKAETYFGIVNIFLEIIMFFILRKSYYLADIWGRKWCVHTNFLFRAFIHYTAHITKLTEPSIPERSPICVQMYLVHCNVISVMHRMQEDMTTVDRDYTATSLLFIFT